MKQGWKGAVRAFFITGGAMAVAAAVKSYVGAPDSKADEIMLGVAALLGFADKWFREWWGKQGGE